MSQIKHKNVMQLCQLTSAVVTWICVTTIFPENNHKRSNRTYFKKPHWRNEVKVSNQTQRTLFDSITYRINQNFSHCVQWKRKKCWAECQLTEISTMSKKNKVHCRTSTGTLIIKHDKGFSELFVNLIS